MKIVKAILTCSACPSQWDAWDSEGKYWYLRYRSGYGTAVNFESQDPDTWTVDQLDNPHFEFAYGDRLDGSITLDLFCQLAGIELELGGMSGAPSQADYLD